MRITFLGTSAGESYPGIWCDCPNCTYAREHGGRNIRMNTGSMIDDDILLDMNSCGFYTAARLGVTLTGVRQLLVTHAHSDHLTTEPLAWRRASADAYNASESERTGMVSPRFTALPHMTVYGNREVNERFRNESPDLFSEDTCISFCEIREGMRVETETFAFTPVRAQHSVLSHSYIIEREGKTLLYALDTGGYDEDMLALICGKKYDAVVMEGTFGNSTKESFGHMNRTGNVRFRNMMIEKGCITSKTPFFLTHLCPHWTPPHDIYAPEMAEEGFIVAYDGLSVEI